jgi:hypothetical protein
MMKIMGKRIQAVSYGCKVPEEGFDASVHSVFSLVANLTVDGLDHLLTLFVSTDTNLPQGIRLPGEGARFIGNLTRGQKVRCQAGILRAEGVDLEIDLNGARKYASPIPILSALSLPETARENWRAVRDLLAVRQIVQQADIRLADLEQPSTSTRLGNQAARKLKMLIQAGRSFEVDAASDAVKALVGLGVGLTPSGDDILVGFQLGTLATIERQDLRARWVNALSRTILRYSSRTNDISRSYLVLAAGGYFSSSLLDLANAICVGAQPNLVRDAAELVFQTGQTSGMDAATGLLAGLSVWDQDL